MNTSFSDSDVLGKFNANVEQTLEQIVSAMPQRCAVAKLVGYCEAIAGSGLVGELMEHRLRLLIAETLSAFNMEPHQEAVKREMAR